MTWDPDHYGDVIEEIPGYEELQDAVAAAATGRNVLELGTGTGETALRVLARNPGARWTGIDGSEAMSVVFFAVAAGSILYVVQELFAVNRKYGHTRLVTWLVLAGIMLGFATDFVVTAAGV